MTPPGHTLLISLVRMLKKANESITVAEQLQLSTAVSNRYYFCLFRLSASFYTMYRWSLTWIGQPKYSSLNLSAISPNDWSVYSVFACSKPYFMLGRWHTFKTWAHPTIAKYHCTVYVRNMVKKIKKKFEQWQRTPVNAVQYPVRESGQNVIC